MDTVPANEKQDVAPGQIRSVTYLGAAVNLGLAAVKITIGLAVGSLAMLADGVHSLSDLVTDAAVLIGSHLGAREPDRTHPYGHGRIETFSAIAVALLLMFVGGAMIYRATMAIARDETAVPHWGSWRGHLLSIVAKEWIYRVTRKVAVRLHSAVAYANAWHHRSDAFSSVAVLIGFVLMEAGFYHGDHLAAIAVGMMVIFVGVKVLADSLAELTEGCRRSRDGRSHQERDRRQSGDPPMASPADPHRRAGGLSRRAHPGGPAVERRRRPRDLGVAGKGPGSGDQPAGEHHGPHRAGPARISKVTATLLDSSQLDIP
jgi:cation diffusion facilitator family transporter